MDRQLTVLVVEDHPGVRGVLEQMVESWLNVDLLSCGSFLEAMTCLHEADHVDLLIADVWLAGEITGVDVAEIAVKTFPSLAVVIISADPASEVAGLTERYSFLLKPFDREQLLEHIDSAYLELKVRMRTTVKAVG